MFVEQCVVGMEHVLQPGLSSPEVPFKTGMLPGIYRELEDRGLETEM